MDMRRVPVATRVVADEQGQERCFRYDLIIDVEECASFVGENYGVGVLEPGGDDVVIQGITFCANRIDELLTLLVDGVVSPTTARDIVADWL